MLLEEVWSVSEVRNHCWVACKEWDCHYGLSPYKPASASTGTRWDSQQSNPISICCKLLQASATLGIRGGSHQNKHAHPNCGCFVPSLPDWLCDLQSVTASCTSHLSEKLCPSHFWLCLLLPREEQTPESGSHTEVRPKPKLNLRDCVTKEEELKFLHTAAQAAN